ncbi:MAG TPA: hypothetical protein DDW49_05400 [Deltaproteobacteria bacterium]|nr:MAG: hypothetical protein A2048_06110 [Deltaproteobacteria bacterium GWA2_45_12]HBF12811.1 hypothetical protein [Deltaproteobacteria bacterium]
MGAKKLFPFILPFLLIQSKIIFWGRPLVFGSLTYYFGKYFFKFTLKSLKTFIQYLWADASRFTF